VNEDIGFQYGKSEIFPDSLATSSDQFDNGDANPRNGKLYTPNKFWCPYDQSEASYLELILVQKYYIFAVSIQGRPTSSGKIFTRAFSISYSDDYTNWEEYNTKFKVS
jgi:hypothetical protein